MKNKETLILLHKIEFEVKLKYKTWTNFAKKLDSYSGCLVKQKLTRWVTNINTHIKHLGLKLTISKL